LAALSAWLGLFEGRWSLVDHVDTDGRRFVIARSNEPDFWPTRPASPLSKRQSQALYCAAAGLSNKEIGYLLGMSSPTVATHLRRGLSVLGISSREDWLRMSGQVEALLGSEAPNSSRLGALTSAEREIAMMILDGASTRRIAAERGTSSSTVSNQISAILSKLDLSNRQALVHYLARH
jgi:DNA-binding CsgD family transcriptional regulator